jgi:4-amino-4-deoxy-L-arabinose transferase-like glycosyltransferase
MTGQPLTPPHVQEGSIIPAERGGVTALCAYAFLAILAALGLRLLFIFRFPGSAEDSDLYLQLARAWADHHVYGFWLNGHLVPTDLRAPGYPAFLAGVAVLFGRSMQAILFSQAAFDVLSCGLTAALASALAPAGSRRRISIIALWLAATCPFVANYSAVVLTETLVTFLATAALFCFVLGIRQEFAALRLRDERKHATPLAWALLGAFLTGTATLVRPEMPLLLVVAVVLYALRGARTLGARKTIFLAAAIAGAFLLPLLPWAARNLITLRKVQFIATRYATLPGEYAPVGFYAWTGTWLERYRDVYLTVWKISEVDQPLDVDELPSAAFDSPEEKARIADLFKEYNDSPDLEITPELDGRFAEIARERTRRHPLRTYVRVPFERALTIWFTPRTELFSIDGKFWPLREQWEDSHADVLVTGGFAVLGYLYVALAVGGIWLAWSAREGRSAAGTALGSNLWGIGLLLAYFLVRTAFLTTVEAPEPRYVVSCYPGVLALIALLGIRTEMREEAIEGSNASK